MAEAAIPGRDELPPPGSVVHLVGVGGAGMRGLACALAGAGWRVSGCDRVRPVDAGDLEGAGVAVLVGHDPAHVVGSALVVHTAAVTERHPELVAARERGVPLLKRARALGALVNGTELVGVSGTHGKTTITAMTAFVLEAAGLDPTALVGGRVPGWDGYARVGAGGPTVVEADEFDRSFLDLDPHLAIVSSVEPEHLESYGTLEELEEAFAEFAGRALPRLGVLACADDEGAMRIAARLPGARTYGLDPVADYRVEAPRGGRDAGGIRLRAPEGVVDLRLGVPGVHNARNAAAAVAAALRLGVEPRRLDGALRSFAGVDRRLQRLADRDGVAVVDDYAHHPTEVRASLAALREAYPDRRLVVVFQPHLYSRTRALAPDFAAALAAADAALVLPIYPAREEPIPGVTSALITGAAPARVRLARREETAATVAEARARRTVLVFMGAGDVTELARLAARELAGHALGG